jgi:hypothetical protein
VCNLASLAKPHRPRAQRGKASQQSYRFEVVAAALDGIQSATYKSKKDAGEAKRDDGRRFTARGERRLQGF